jgi:hypothetical protein
MPKSLFQIHASAPFARFRASAIRAAVHASALFAGQRFAMHLCDRDSLVVWVIGSVCTVRWLMVVAENTL